MLYPDRMLHFHGFGRHRDLHGIRKVRRTLPFETSTPSYNAFVCCQCRLVGMSVGLGVFCSLGVYVSEQVSVSVCFEYSFVSISVHHIFIHLCLGFLSVSECGWRVSICRILVCRCRCRLKCGVSLSQCLYVSILVGCGVVCLWFGLLVRVFLLWPSLQ